MAVTLWELEAPAEAAELLNSEIETTDREGARAGVITMALSRMTPTWDPIGGSLFASGESAWRAGFLDRQPDLSGIYDLVPPQLGPRGEGSSAVEPPVGP